MRSCRQTLQSLSVQQLTADDWIHRWSQTGKGEGDLFHTASKGLRRRVCQQVQASLTMANPTAQTDPDFWPGAVLMPHVLQLAPWAAKSCPAVYTHPKMVNWPELCHQKGHFTVALQGQTAADPDPCAKDPPAFPL